LHVRWFQIWDHERRHLAWPLRGAIPAVRFSRPSRFRAPSSLSWRFGLLRRGVHALDWGSRAGLPASALCSASAVFWLWFVSRRAVRAEQALRPCLRAPSIQEAGLVRLTRQRMQARIYTPERMYAAPDGVAKRQVGICPQVCCSGNHAAPPDNSFVLISSILRPDLKHGPATTRLRVRWHGECGVASLGGLTS
jgi:hypothetical protein